MTIAAEVASADIGLRTARYLLIATLFATLVSTSLTVGLEFAVYGAFACFPSLRARLIRLARNPAALALAAFLAIVAFATLYGYANWSARWSALAGWRKALLFFFAAAAFDDDDGRRELMRTYLTVCLAVVAASFVGYFANAQVYKFNGPGVLLHNYATQSFAFAIAAGVAGVALLNPARFAADPILGRRALLATAAALFVADIVFVLQGRSGYIAIGVVCAALAVAFLGRSPLGKLLVGLCAVALVAGLVALSGVARQRIALMLNEMATVETSPVETSAGVRVVMWKTTLRMIADHPVMGVGTGSFKAGYAREAEGLTGWQATPSGDPHNQFLKIWAEQGAAGIAAFLSFLILAAAAKTPAPYRALGVAILLAACATSLFNSHYSTFTEGRLVFLWLGAMLVRAAPNGVENARLNG